MFDRNENTNAKGHAGDGVSPLASEKTERAITLVKTGTDIVKTTPAGEYLTSALNDFDPEQYDSLAAISDGANKLLMLVGTNIYIFMHSTGPVKVKMRLLASIYISL